MADLPISAEDLDSYFASTVTGSLDRAIGNDIYGFNQFGTGSLVPSNRETYGLTFIVKPQLNLQSSNVRASRIMSSLMNKNPTSVQRVVRSILDPRFQRGFNLMRKAGITEWIPGNPCPLVDPKMAFIPVLTNNLKSMSGWPDAIVPTYSSSPGLYKEVFSMVDGSMAMYGEYDLDLTFRNIRGDIIPYLFYIWERYTTLTFDGTLLPYLDFITERELDYTTRIYRVLLDTDKRTVTKVISTGACFPVTNPIGMFGDFNSEVPFLEQNKDISIRFRCMGMEIFDDILIKEFNDTVAIFNPEMKDEFRDSSMGLLSDDAIIAGFKNRGYPRINPETSILEWWYPQQDIESTLDNAFNLFDE